MAKGPELRDCEVHLRTVPGEQSEISLDLRGLRRFCGDQSARGQSDLSRRVFMGRKGDVQAAVILRLAIQGKPETAQKRYELVAVEWQGQRQRRPTRHLALV